MNTQKTYRRTVPILAGLAVAIAVGIGITGGQLIASIDQQMPAAQQTSQASSTGGYTVVYKDPNGPWPGEPRSESRALEVAAGIFINPDKGFDI